MHSHLSVRSTLRLRNMVLDGVQDSERDTNREDNIQVVCMHKPVKRNMEMYNSQVDNRQVDRIQDHNSTPLKNGYQAQSTMRHMDQNKNDRVDNTG